MGVNWRQYSTTVRNTGLRNAIQLIDQAMLASGWVQEASTHSWDSVAGAGYTQTGSPLPSDPASLGTSVEYFRIVYTIGDSLSGTSKWRVRLLWMTGSSSTSFTLKVKIGKTISGSGSTVDFSDGGTELVLPNLNQTFFTDFFVSAYDSGLAVNLSLNGSSSMAQFSVERCRDFSGTVTSDIFLLAYGYASGMTGMSEGQTLAREWSGNELSANYSLYLNNPGASFGPSDHTTVSPTIIGSGNTELLMVGPYIRGGGVKCYGRPRLTVAAPYYAIGSRQADVQINQDGVTRTFYVPGSHGTILNGITSLMAKN